MGSSSVTYISRIGDGIQSISQLPELETSASTVESLNLHSNRISSLEGLQRLVSLRSLNLSSNIIVTAPSLAALSNLTSLNLASNRLQQLPNLAGLSKLVTLNVSYNFLTDITGISFLSGSSNALQRLNLQHNNLQSLQTLGPLAGCLQLKQLKVGGNPCTFSPASYVALRQVLPHIKDLDEGEAVDLSAGWQIAQAQLQAYESSHSRAPDHAGQGAPASSASSHLPATFYWPAAAAVQAPYYQLPAAGVSSPAQQQQLQQQDRRSKHRSKSPRCSHITTQRLQQQKRRGRSPSKRTSSPDSHSSSRTSSHSRSSSESSFQDLDVNMAAALPSQEDGPKAQQVRGQQHRSHQHPHQQQKQGEPQQSSRMKRTNSIDRDMDVHAGRDAATTCCTSNKAGKSSHTAAVLRHGMGSRAGSSSQGDGPHQQDKQQQRQIQHLGSLALMGASSVPCAEAGTQTQEFVPQAVMQLQGQVEQLRSQLATLADALETSRAAEGSLRVQMCDAIRAAEAEAHRKVEDSYQEASFAVSRAVEVADAARSEASEAKARFKELEQQLHQAQAEAKHAKADAMRLQEEAARVQERAEQQQAGAARALAEECERHSNSEKQLQQQIKELTSQVAVSQAQVKSQEQQLTALEAALQKGNQVTVSMTERVASTMSDAQAQVDAMKGKLSIAEQQLKEAAQRETLAQAQVQLVKESLAAAQQQHQQQLEQLRQQHEGALAKAGDDIKSHKAAAEQSRRDAGIVQEQLAYLKAQLQFVLQEAEREVQDGQTKLSSKEEELSALNQALAAASARQQEQTALMAELTHALQQHKSQLQDVLREKAELQQQLSRCTPAEFDRLHNELLVAKRAAVQLPAVQRELQQHQQLWQEAEQKLSNLQVQHAQLQKEAAARAAALEGQLEAGKQELALMHKALEQLKDQLSAAQDAVKVKTAMVNDAQETVVQLKGELADLQQDAEDARQAAEKAEALLLKHREGAAEEAASLRAEVAAGEAALEQLEGALAAATGKLQEAEARAKAAMEASAEKDAMIKFVEEEVERVKQLFDKKETRLREESEKAKYKGEQLAAAKTGLEAQVLQLQGQLDDAASQLDQQQRDAAAAISKAAAAAQQVAAAQAEAARQRARVAEVEGEMRQLLEAVESQKAASAAKMRQLAFLLQDM